MQRTSTQRTALLPGFGVLFHKEFLEARRSKRIVVFAVIMTGALLLVPVISYLRIENFGTGSRHQIRADDMRGMVGAWAALIGYLGSLMVIASTVDAMVRERASGISAWILTKPVSRPSYILAKASAHAAINVITLIVIPTAIWLAVTLALFADVPGARVFLASGILGVEILFLSFLTISLGVPFRSVTPISTITLAVWFLPNFVPAIASLEWTYRVLPSYLPLAAFAAAADSDLTSPLLTIPIASLVAVVILTALALLQFERQEL